MFPPELPLNSGQMATILVITEASLVFVIYRLHRIIKEERAKANSFRNQVVRAVNGMNGAEGIIGVLAQAVVAPIGKAIAERIANPPPQKPKSPKEVKKDATKQQEQEQEAQERVNPGPDPDSLPGGQEEDGRALEVQ